MALRWRIYYRTGETENSNHSTWETAQRHDVVAVVWQCDNSSVQVELGTPYYLKFEDWIARVWDPTLYLRKMSVKFGRWARRDMFQEAWQKALCEMEGGPIATDHPSMLSSVVSKSRSAVQGDSRFQFHVWLDDGKQYWGDDIECWEGVPTDGVLSACYKHVFNGVLFALAVRRYTYFYWRGMELKNTDDILEVLVDFPQFKIGCPAFEGRSYLHQAEAISDALHDTLEDVT